ncbi:MAG TPA: DUF309 domain-containing protein [Bdellovibrionota bacterium]|nr:DUF309 domain-containing protein [Bdellovibrionota bacterium]
MPTRRYTNKPFPSYRYLPGRTSHPIRDPKGHAYGKVTTPIHLGASEEAGRHPDFLFGVDLFNAGYYWEAHEAWEGVWKALPPSCEESICLQGLIQVSAGLLKKVVAETEGSRQLISKGLEKLKVAQGRRPNCLGLDFVPFITALEKAEPDLLEIFLRLSI